MSGEASIGLDLGAGKCCVASVRAGAVTVLPNAHGDKTTPSFVAFTDSRSLVGSDARDQAALNPENTFYGVKTVLGRNFSRTMKGEPCHSNGTTIPNQTSKLIRPLDEEDLTVLPYLPAFSTTEDDSLIFKVEYRKENVKLRPEQITALLIAKMKSEAESHLGSEVTNAVISVPVNFSNAQRQATLDAARIAGLKNVTLINSTTAVAIAYWDYHPKEDDCVAVVDFGASSLSLAVVSIDQNAVKVKEAFGCSTVSGNFFDLCMMKAVINKFEDEHMYTFTESAKHLMRFRAATEKLKHDLTLLPSSVIQADTIFNDVDFTCLITRQEMEDVCLKQLGNLRGALDRLANNNDWAKVRTVVMVGGSTRIPAVEKLIAKTLRKPLDHSLNKDEAVACGAALRAAELGCSTPREVEEVLPRRVWYKAGSESGTIIDFDAPIPGNFNFAIPVDIWKKLNDSGLTLYENVRVFMGNGIDTSELTITRLRPPGFPASSGTLLFTIDESGVFQITLLSSEDKWNIQTRGLSSDAHKMKACKARHKMFLDDERRWKENENVINEIGTLCLDLREKFRQEFGQESAAFKACDEFLRWLENEPKATKQECNQKKLELDRQVSEKVMTPVHTNGEALSPQTAVGQRQHKQSDTFSGDAQKERSSYPKETSWWSQCCCCS
ncbi:putative heat shock 70 kDa protein 7 [Hyalella azteca]|nr:putative heat shock 70 kDa protein 7 [Hyalella azteca]